jgi:hypothetical protein
MSASQSTLSESRFGYDMVMAVTQTSLNATLKEWLSNQQGKTFDSCFLNKSDAPWVIDPLRVDIEYFKSQLGFDPFSIPASVKGHNQKTIEIASKNFLFGFRAELGYPEATQMLDTNIVEFNQQGTKVSYNLTFKNLTIYSLTGELGPYWQVVSQNDFEKPWIINFQVDIKQRSADINRFIDQLPKNVQTEVDGIGRDMFSIEQLYLDVNAKLASTATLKNVEPGTPIHKMLTQWFLPNFLMQMDLNYGVPLGFAAVTNDPYLDQASIIPTSMNFQIVPYREYRKPTADYDLYTLNYLIMSKNRVLPPPAQFDWNWVDKDKVSLNAGSTAINRDIFTIFLSDLFNPIIKDMMLTPDLKFEVDSNDYIHYRVSYKRANEDWGYGRVPGNSRHILTYTHDTYQQKSGRGSSGSLSSRYTLTSDIYLTDEYNSAGKEDKSKKIVVKTTVNIFVYFNVGGSIVEGNFVHKEITSKYTIDTDSFGKLTVVQDSSDIVDTSVKPDISTFMKWRTDGKIVDAVDRISEKLKNMTERYLDGSAEKMADRLNGSQGWVFPGGKTFAFKDAEFSQGYDLVANVLYIQPDTPPQTVAKLLKQAKKEDKLLAAKHLSAQK